MSSSIHSKIDTDYLHRGADRTRKAVQEMTRLGIRLHVGSPSTVKNWFFEATIATRLPLLLQIFGKGRNAFFMLIGKMAHTMFLY